MGTMKMSDTEISYSGDDGVYTKNLQTGEMNSSSDK